MLQLFSTSSRNNNTTHFAANRVRRNSRSYDFNGQYFIVVFILLIGAVLRLYRLGDLNLWCDEDITALAVKGILQHGYPELPSGMIYFRTIITTYLSALSASFWGFNEMALRLPSVVFSLGTGYVLFLLGKKMFSVRVGLVAAIIHTFSFWDVEFARHARMYEAFAFFFTFALYAIYRGVVASEKRWFKWSLVVSCSTIFVHILGVVLAFIYMALAISLQGKWRRTVQLFGIAAGLMFVATGYFFLIKYGFSIPGIAALPSYEQLFQPLMKNVLQAPVYGFQNHFVTTAIYLILSLIAVKHLRKKGLSWNRWAWTIPICTFLLFIMQQPLAAIILLCLFLFFSRNKEKTVIQSLARISIILIVAVVMLQASIIIHYLPAESLTNENLFNRMWIAVKMLVGFPKLYYFGFLTAFPAMTSMATVGLFILYRQSNRSPKLQKTCFVVSAFILPMIANGFIAGRFIEYRVNFYLNPFFILLFAFMIVEYGQSFNTYLKKKAIINSRRILALAIYGCLSVLACEQVHPNRLQDIIIREYGAKIDKTTAPGSHLRIMPDHISAGKFVRENRRLDDVVVVTDWLAQRFYTGKIDYWLRTNAYVHQSFSSGDKFFDIYTGTQIITELESLKVLLANCKGRRVWLIIALPYENVGLHLSGDIINFLRTEKQNVVFRGRDGASKVYLFSGDRSSDANSRWLHASKFSVSRPF